MARRVMIDKRLLAALYEAGICDDDAAGVVIDIQQGQVPIVHTEKYGDEQLIHLVRALDGIEIEKR